MRKDHIRTLKILQSVSEFGGLWKHPNNPARSKSARVFESVEDGHYTEEEEEEEEDTVTLI